MRQESIKFISGDASLQITLHMKPLSQEEAHEDGKIFWKNEITKKNTSKICIVTLFFSSFLFKKIIHVEIFVRVEHRQHSSAQLFEIVMFIKMWCYEPTIRNTWHFVLSWKSTPSRARHKVRAPVLTYMKKRLSNVDSSILKFTII